MKTRTFIAASLAIHARTITTPRLLIIRRAWLWTGFLAFATIVFEPRATQAAVTEAWVQRYGSEIESGPEDYAYKAMASAIAVDGSGNVFVTGSSNDGGYYEYATIAYSSAGVPIWTNRYNGTTNSYFNNATAVAVNARGNVIVTGHSNDGRGYYEYATIAYSSAGVPLWTNRYNGTTNSYFNYATAVAVDGSGNVFVTGYSHASGGKSDYLTIAYSDAGIPLWTNRYNGPADGDDQASALAVDGSGNVVVTGYSWGTGNSDGDYYTAKYSGADGSVLWQQRYNGPENFYDHATAVAVDASGNVVVTGSSWGTNYNFDYYTAKYAAGNGALLWERRYNGPGNGYDSATAVAVDASGNVVVTGYFGGPDSNIPEMGYYTAKYAASNGSLLWEKHYNGPANLADSASAVAVDASGNVVVTGYVDSPFGYFDSIGGDYYTAKYAASDGATLWEKRFYRLSPLGPSPCLALAPNGTVAVSGSASGDFATVVYREVSAAVSIDLISAGVRVRFSGISGRTYNIERALAVTGPWSTINTQTAPASGLFGYLDTNPPAPAAFYRTREP